MKRLVLFVCLLLFGCSDSAPPGRGTEAAPASPEPACPNQQAVVADESLRTGGALAGDVDGDGSEDDVAIAFDRDGPEGCQAFVVVRNGGKVVIAGPLRRWRSDFGLTAPAIRSVQEMDDEPGAEIVVRMGAGASTEFVAIVTTTDGALRQVSSEVPDQVGEGLFGVGGSVGHIEAVDCAPAGGIVASFASPAGRLYRVERRFLEFEGTRLVEERVEVERSGAAGLDRFPEYRASPFGSCSG